LEKEEKRDPCMSRPKSELKTLQSLRDLQLFFDVAKLSTPLLDRYTSPARPDLGEVVRLAKRFATERQIELAHLREAERNELVQETLAHEQERIAREIPSKKACMTEVFEAFSRRWPVGRKDLESKHRRREFEVIPPEMMHAFSGPAEKTPVGLVTYDDPPKIVLSSKERLEGEGPTPTGEPILSEHDLGISAGKLRAGVLRVSGSVFIIAEDDRPAKLELCELVSTVRSTLGQIADKPEARAWIINPPFHVDVIRRHPNRNTITRADSGAWQCFLGLLENVDPTRIKRCPVCQDVFPMLRKNQKTCSPNCANVERVRKSRGYYKKYRERSLRTGLKRIRGAQRRRLIELSQALRSIEEDELT
jgi:hypothetical protein